MALPPCRSCCGSRSTRALARGGLSGCSPAPGLERHLVGMWRVATVPGQGSLQVRSWPGAEEGTKRRGLQKRGGRRLWEPGASGMSERWGERVRASREPKRSSKGKSKSPARSDGDRNVFSEGDQAALPRALLGECPERTRSSGSSTFAPYPGRSQVSPLLPRP